MAKDILGVDNRVVIRCEWVHYHVTCHGQVFLTGSQLGWREEKRNELARVTTRFLRTILGLPTGYTTVWMECKVRRGKDEVIEKMRKIRSGIQNIQEDHRWRSVPRSGRYPEFSTRKKYTLL